MSTKTFILYWKDGTTSTAEGKDLSDAFNRWMANLPPGIGGRARERTLISYEEVDVQKSRHEPDA